MPCARMYDARTDLKRRALRAAGAESGDRVRSGLPRGSAQEAELGQDGRVADERVGHSRNSRVHHGVDDLGVDDPGVDDPGVDDARVHDLGGPEDKRKLARGRGAR